jgi:hypothetical protein
LWGFTKGKIAFKRGLLNVCAVALQLAISAGLTRKPYRIFRYISTVFGTVGVGIDLECLDVFFVGFFLGGPLNESAAATRIVVAV